MSDAEVRDYVKARLIESLEYIQRAAGRDTPPITEETMPLQDLEGFTSLNGLEAAADLSARVRVEIEEIDFVVKETNRQMTMREIVDSIAQRHGRQIADALATPADDGHSSSTMATATLIRTETEAS